MKFILWLVSMLAFIGVITLAAVALVFPTWLVILLGMIGGFVITTIALNS